MKTFKYVIKDELGIHARPAGLLAKEAKQYESTITIAKGEKTASASQLMKLMSLGVKQGDEIEVTVEGSDEEVACAAMETFLQNNL